MKYDDVDHFQKKYKIIGTLGQGAHAMVYKVERLEDKHLFAAKMTKCFDEEIQEMVSHFLFLLKSQCKFEFDLMKKVNHPNIVKAREFLENELLNESYLVMELIEYPPLQKHIESVKQIPEDQMQIIALKVLRGLRTLHKKGICHRDLSPANILCKITNDQIKVKIIDFGVAQKFKSGGFAHTMLTNTGNPAYRAPEIVEGEEYS